MAVYGKSFDPATSLRALCSYRDGDLAELKNEIKERLASKAAAVEKIPVVIPLGNL